MNQNQYKFGKYADRDRWMSYWHQLLGVLRFNPDSALVVGKGDGLVSDVLRKKIAKVTTIDIDRDLNPDIAASVENIPLADNSFDVVLCAEVLEHLPFEKFKKCLLEIKRVARENIILSLPHFGPPVKLFLKIPFLREMKLFFKMPIPMPHKYSGEHYWEIGKRGYPVKKIKKTIESSGLKIINDFIAPESPYHHFFVINKKSQ